MYVEAAPPEGPGRPVRAGWEPNQKLVVSYSWFNPVYCGITPGAKVCIKVCNVHSVHSGQQSLLPGPAVPTIR